MISSAVCTTLNMLHQLLRRLYSRSSYLKCSIKQLLKNLKKFWPNLSKLPVKEFVFSTFSTFLVFYILLPASNIFLSKERYWISHFNYFCFWRPRIPNSHNSQLLITFGKLIALVYFRCHVPEYDNFFNNNKCYQKLSHSLSYDKVDGK